MWIYFPQREREVEEVWALSPQPLISSGWIQTLIAPGFHVDPLIHEQAVFYNERQMHLNVFILKKWFIMAPLL